MRLQTRDEYQAITLDAGERGTLKLRARAPDLVDDRRRVMTVVARG